MLWLSAKSSSLSTLFNSSMTSCSLSVRVSFSNSFITTSLQALKKEQRKTVVRANIPGVHRCNKLTVEKRMLGIPLHPYFTEENGLTGQNVDDARKYEDDDEEEEEE